MSARLSLIRSLSSSTLARDWFENLSQLISKKSSGAFLHNHYIKWHKPQQIPVFSPENTYWNVCPQEKSYLLRIRSEPYQIETNL